MFVFWSTKNELKRIPFGKKKQLLCGNCNNKATFYECNKDEGVKIYGLLDVWKNTKRVMQCGECLAVCDYYDMFPDEKVADELAAAKRKQDEETAKRQEEAKRAEEERLRREAAQRVEEEFQRKKEAERAAERAKREAQVDDELEALKKKIRGQ